MMSSIERIYKRTNTMYLGFSSGRGGNQRGNETKTNGLKKKTDLKENLVVTRKRIKKENK